MKLQKPAEGILLRRDHEDSKSYSIMCQCCGSDCEHNVWVEADDCGISVTTYVKQKTNFWSKTRWNHIWTLLIKGYVETEASIIMSQQQALNYAGTIQLAIKDVESFRGCKHG
jgi:hypothetical protein